MNAFKRGRFGGSRVFVNWIFSTRALAALLISVVAPACGSDPREPGTSGAARAGARTAANRTWRPSNAAQTATQAIQSSPAGAPSASLVDAASAQRDLRAWAHTFMASHPAPTRDARAAAAVGSTGTGPAFAPPTQALALSLSTATPAAFPTIYPLSEDGKYYKANLLYRNYFPPKASATFSSGVHQLGAAAPPFIFDGRDQAFTAVTDTPGDPNVTVTLTVDMGGYFSVGAVRPLYQPLGGGYPFSQRIRLASKLGPNADWLPVFDGPVTPADTTLSFAPTAGRYLELTMTGNGCNLLELFVYPSAATSPPPTSQSGYDLTALGALSEVNSNFWPLGSQWPQSWPAGSFRPRTDPGSTTGDAVGIVDLGAQYPLSKVALGFFWSTPWANGGRIEVAATPDAYTTVADSGLGHEFFPWPNVLDFNFSTQLVRYIRATNYFTPRVGVSPSVLWSVQAFADTPPHLGYYPLSDDGKYFNINLIRRPVSDTQPTALVSYSNGAVPFSIASYPQNRNDDNVLDGDDLSFNWSATSGTFSDAMATVTVDLKRVQTIGAFRMQYGNYWPLGTSLRVATSPSGPWTQIFENMPVTASDSSSSFEGIAAQYLELTMKGTTSVGFVNLAELKVYPSSATDPAPSSGSHLDLTYLNGIKYALDVNLSYGGGAIIHSVDGAAGVYIKSAAQGADGDGTLTLDLGQQFQISEVDLSFFGSSIWSSGGKLDVADSAGNWQLVFDSGRGTPLGLAADGTQKIRFAPQTTRYLRVTGYFDPTQSSGLLTGVEVFGENVPCAPNCESAGTSTTDCSIPGSSCAVRRVSLVIPQSTTLSELALFGNTVTLGSGVSVLSPSTHQAAAIAAGPGGLSIGAESVVGGVTSGGDVSIASGAGVRGPILAAGSVTNESALVDPNSFEQGSGPLLMTQQVFSVPWPAADNDPLNVAAGQSITSLPRYYGTVNVAPGGTMRLLAGDHYFDSLTVQVGGHLIASNTAGSVRIFLRGPLDFSGDLTQESDDANVVFISDSTTVNLLSSIRATVWAPEAQLTLASGGVFTGSFIGDVVRVQPGALINREPTFQQPVFALEGGSPGSPDACLPGGEFFKSYDLSNFVSLENTRDWLCLPTALSGKLSEISVRPAHGFWEGHVASDTYGTATCIHKSCFSSNDLKLNGVYHATASAVYSPGLNLTYLSIPPSCDGKTDKQMAGAIDEATFIAQFDTSHPRGQGEKFRIEQSSVGSSSIDAYDEQCNPGTVTGYAYSVRAGPAGQPALFDGPNASHAPIETAGKVFLDSNSANGVPQLLAPVSDAVCYLSSISGQFAGGGEGASIDTVSDDSGQLYWRLLVRHQNGGVPGGVQAEATCYARNQDVCSSSSSSMDPAFCDPLVRQRFDWLQWSPPHVMGTASDRACFLTALSGDFRGGSERIAITRSNGVWQLNGISKQQGVYGEAQCVAVPSTSNETVWDNSMAPADLGPTDHRACFLTAFSGRLGGGGESVHIYREGGRWQLSGTTQQQYITASARCIPVESVGPEQVWGQGNPRVQLTQDPPNPRTVCFLTGVTGRFDGGGEAAEVTAEPGPSGALIQWLGGRSEQVGVESRAVCATLDTDPLAGPPEPALPAGAPDCSLSSVEDPEDCVGVAFANRFAGAGLDTDGFIATSYSCRPLTCFQSSAPDSIASVSPSMKVDSTGCAPSQIALLAGDAVSHLLTFRSASSELDPSFYPATRGDGEWAKVTQGLDKESQSLLEVQHCSDQNLGATGSSLLLNTSGSAVKFIALDGVISTYDAARDDFEVNSAAGTTSVRMTPTATTTCVFTRAQGNFIRGGEYVSIDQTDIDGVDYWVLHAQHLSGNGVSATARCFPNNQSSQ